MKKSEIKIYWGNLLGSVAPLSIVLTKAKRRLWTLFFHFDPGKRRVSRSGSTARSRRSTNGACDSQQPNSHLKLPLCYTFQMLHSLSLWNVVLCTYLLPLCNSLQLSTPQNPMKVNLPLFPMFIWLPLRDTAVIVNWLNTRNKGKP